MRRAFLAISGGLALFTLLVGLAHTRVGRPALGRALRALGHGGSCPFGYDRVATPAEREAQRSAFARTHAGVNAPHARPALGFTLDATTKADVAGWAAAHGLACTQGRGAMVDLACENVPDRVLPEPFRGMGSQSLWFGFGAGEKLIAVTAIAGTDRVRTALDSFARVEERVTDEAGAPTATGGDPSERALASGALYQAFAEYRFAGYYAVARATNVGAGRGYALTQEYRSLPN